jgi:CHAD domain-containing protein
VARRTGLSRDLDVLRQRFEASLLPALPAVEQERLRPALKRLARDRKLAHRDLVEALNGGRYLKLLARLGRWQRKPVFTTLGLQPLQGWLLDWQAPIAADLFLQPGWFAEDPCAETLHPLRKRIKAVRYALEHLQPCLDATLLAWLADLRQAQDDLGELHDWQVLEASLADRALRLDAADLPVLMEMIRSQQLGSWRRWQERAARLGSVASRRGLRQHLLETLDACSQGGLWPTAEAPVPGDPMPADLRP